MKSILSTAKKVAVIAGLLAAGAANAATVANGSFEDTTQANGTWTIYNSISGWNSSTLGVEVRNNAVGTTPFGNNFVELDTTGNSSIAQIITTVKNQMYELTFWYSPRINRTDAADNGISAFWNGAQQGSTPTAQGVGQAANNWVLYKFLVTGTGNDTLKFAATGNSNSYGGNIDNVALSAVPLPGAALLFASSLLGFIGASRRRKV